jgi:hypothetical protein
VELVAGTRAEFEDDAVRLADEGGDDRGVFVGDETGSWVGRC